VPFCYGASPYTLLLGADKRSDGEYTGLPSTDQPRSALNISSLIRFSQCVVVAVFGLILVGGLVTSWQAGMAVPDWPLSFGSLNPEGWWGRLPVRLEHGHRLIAACVGVLVGVLCAQVWANFRALKLAAVFAVLAPLAGRLLGAENGLVAHLGVWPAALAFIVSLLRSRTKATNVVGSVERGLAMTAFVLVCLQASLGGLRVTQETAGAVDVALVLRIFHACVAQAFLVVIVSLSTRLVMLGSAPQPRQMESGAVLRRLTLFAVMAVYAQLIVGATMRHLGAGLVIPTFPLANLEGGFLPVLHGLHIDLNFAHTRIGAILVSISVLANVFWIARSCSSVSAMRWSGLRSLTLLLSQVALGILVIWHLKPPLIASLHVVVGAALLANLASCFVRLQAVSYGFPSSERQ
jgi:cytochrome c oxidase assembly protein subunit 15